jgi:hypothetical protein
MLDEHKDDPARLAPGGSRHRRLLVGRVGDHMIPPGAILALTALAAIAGVVGWAVCVEAGAVVTVGRRVATFTEIERPGDYCGPVDWDGAQACFFLKPNARDPDTPLAARGLQWVRFPPHTYRECPDGSLEIRASISDMAGGNPESDGWHGYLDEGNVWRQV